MTRINANIPVSRLSDEHLITEHREIKRIPNQLAKYVAAGKSIPAATLVFKLGPGHVKFFYDKGAFLRKRYKFLYDECKVRGMNVTDFNSAFEIFDKLPNHCNDWTPTEADQQMIIDRITIKVICSSKLRWHMYHKSQTYAQLIHILNNSL